MRKEVTIVIDFKIYLYLFEPIIRKFNEKGVKIHLAVPEVMHNDVKRIFPDIAFDFVNFERIKKENRLRFILHRACSLLFTRTDFSFQFQKKRQQLVRKNTGTQGFLLWLSKFMPKVPNKSINRFLNGVSRIGLTNPYPTELILVGTLNASAELLSAKDQTVVTVMESWDHAVKEPNGYNSHLVYTWNDSLANDWVKNQGENNCRSLFPLKLRYPLENRKTPIKTDSSKKKKVAMYAISSTSRFSVPVMTDLDIRIIEDLIKATREAGWTLILKPRPNGTEGEFDHYAEHEHVEVMDIGEHVENPANYYLDDEYNKLRFSSLDDVDVVINAFSTFGFDAACYGVPVIQLDLRQNASYLDSYLVFNNYHLKTHVLGRENVFNVIDQPLEVALKEALTVDLSFAEGYSQEVYEWLTSGLNIDDALEEFYVDVMDVMSNLQLTTESSKA
ncbi:hypothetical protein L4D06_00955 [Enterovibrio makurazakiensis]|uniref:hypothetical protein n=1 Tax=Enterovibrio makurazakiensis TaxID=2910232 RepID=UPI003D1972C1